MAQQHAPGFPALAGALALAALALAPALAGPAGQQGAPPSQRIFTYPLPACSFEHFPPDRVDDPGGQFPPVLPIHRHLAGGKYATTDPRNATLFYVPAPFFLWDNSGMLFPPSGSPVRSPCTSALLYRQQGPANATVGVPASVRDRAGRGAWTLTLWMKSPGAAPGRRIVAEAGLPAGRAVYDLGLSDGCLSALGRGCTADVMAPGPCHSLGDEHWHHVGAAFDGTGQLSLYMDGKLVVQSELPGGARATDAPPSALGGGGGAAPADAGPPGPSATPSPDLGQCPRPAAQAHRAALHGLHLYEAALDGAHVEACAGSRSPESACFRQVRRFVEGAPWLRRRGGRDHFVLFAGHDYPSVFDPHQAPADEHFVLEAAWPAFKSFAVLHFGARTERCGAPFLAPALGPDAVREGAAQMPECARRLLRTVTIPPLLPGEPLRCRDIEARLEAPRRLRLAYRGLAYGAMVERSVFARLAATWSLQRLQAAGWVQLEFTNWTYEKLSTGACTEHTAFEGLCAWSSIGQPLPPGWNSSRAKSMRDRAISLWAVSDLCLVLPGDGGYERRLYSILSMGCVPVIVNARSVSFPKLPFVASLPWHEFAIFWSLDPADLAVAGADFLDFKEGLARSALQLLQQLLALGTAALARKRAALLRHAPSLSWAPAVPCRGGGRRPGALDLVVLELAHAAQLPEEPAHFAPADWRRKDALEQIRASAAEDVTGNGCPLGFMACLRPRGRPGVGDTCHTSVAGVGWSCPCGCAGVEGPVQCADGKDRSTPCRARRCTSPVHAIDMVDPAPNPLRPQEPRIAIVSFSDRAALRDLTWPSLRRFAACHPGRYDLLLGREPLLDGRDFHPAWNKLAWLRRALLVGHPRLQYKYDAVAWLDDDIVITSPERDALHEAITDKLLCPSCKQLVLASRDEVTWDRVPLNSGLLVLKRDEATLQLIEDLFRISRRPQLFGGVWRLPRTSGWWDQDAIAAYIRDKGSGLFAIVEHRVLQSLVRPQRSQWLPGDFAAHLTNLPSLGGAEAQLAFVEQFLNNISALQDTDRCGSTELVS